MNDGPRATLDLRARLRAELERRRRVNRRYSLRAFADYLSVDHSTLSQLLRGRRTLTGEQLRHFSARLGLGAEETECYAAASMAEAAHETERRVRTLHWLGEAASVLERPAHWKLLQLLRSPDWRPDMRWISASAELPIDELNDALSRLLRLGMLEIGAGGAWRDTSGLADPSERAVKECALARMRMLSAA